VRHERDPPVILKKQMLPNLTELQHRQILQKQSSGQQAKTTKTTRKRKTGLGLDRPKA
jgi:hypothetical protein